MEVKTKLFEKCFPELLEHKEINVANFLHGDCSHILDLSHNSG